MAFSAGFNGLVKLDASPGGSLTDYSAYVTSLDLDLPVELLDTTTFGKTQRTRIAGLKDLTGTITFNSDPTITAVIAGLLQSSETISFEFGPEGSTAASGQLKLTGECMLGGMSTSTAVDGLNTFSVPISGSDTTTVGTY